MRLLLVALMLALATPVSAKTLIVADVPYMPHIGGADYDAASASAAWSRAKYITDILDATGSSYVVIDQGSMRTDWARTGDVTWNFGTSSAYVEHFDAVIHSQFGRRSTAANRTNSSYRPDSLTLSAVAGNLVTNKLLVPQLMLNSYDAGITLFVNATTCTTGVGLYAHDADSPSFGANVVASSDMSVNFDPATNERWQGQNRNPYDSLLSAHLIISAATPVPNKGLRILLGVATGSMDVSWKGSQVYPGEADSFNIGASPGSAQVWMVQNAHISGGKPIVYAEVGGGLGLDAVRPNGLEVLDPTVLWVAMAALDSAAGGLVFDNKGALPLQAAITVDGLCSRSMATNSGGIVPSDTTRFYGTIDSLRTWGIRATFGVNLDSVASYPRDLQYVKDNMPLARFSPQSRAGLDTAVAFAPAALGGNNRRNRAVDTFGRYRNQAMAYGSLDGAAKDTSLYARLKYALALGDSIWGFGRTSRFALPPDDDWSPYNMRGQQMNAARGVTVDSVLFAYAKAGFRGIRINGSWAAGNPQKTPNNPRGYVQEQGRYETADRGLRINLVAHNGNSTWGNRPYNWSLMTDSLLDPTLSQGYDAIATQMVPSTGSYVTLRFWHGLSGAYSQVRDNNSAHTFTLNEGDENSTGIVGKARILKMSCQELAGPAHSATMGKNDAPRPGWWSIKRVVMPVRLINRLAGRTIINIGYPEDIVLR